MRSILVGFRGALSAVLVCASVTGCPGPSTATLEIQAPEDGSTLTLATDVAPEVPGLQARVVVAAVGVAVGSDVHLLVDRTGLVGTLPVPTDGMIVYESVTLPSGTHELEAITELGDVRSPRITLTVEDSCFSVGFLTPTPGTAPVTLGPSDDTDGEACGDTFETSVVVSTAAPDGSEGRIYVNGTPRRTARAAGGVIRFDAVAFDYRGDEPNTLSVDVTNSIGVTCMAEFPVQLFVDCAGVSCVITAPTTGTAFLNENDDVSSSPGFQGDFAVTTDVEGSTQAVRLVVDGDETNALSALPDGTIASFGNVSLSEGVHRVQAICSDGAGNTTRSGAAEWTVDTVPCSVSISEPTEGETIIQSDDLDPGTLGIQIDASGSIGTDCTELRVGLCSGIDALPFAVEANSFTERVTLSSSATQEVCAQVHDAAGNLGSTMVGIAVRTDDPQLEIVTPTAGTGYNIDGSGGRIADLTSGNLTCEARFEVYCTEVGVPVTLIRLDTSTTLGTATCAAEAGLPAPYAGRATFTSVSLPSVNDGSSFQVEARQEADRLIGRSDPVALASDCVAPTLTITRPICGSVIRPSDDDELMITGLQYRTVVQNPSDPSADVTLDIRPAGGGASIYTATNTLDVSPSIFPLADYTAGGALDVVATATDNAGNVGSVVCGVTVADLPTLSITQPANGATLTGSDDCSGSAGMQVQVTASTDASDSSSATITVGGGSPIPASVSGGAISACVDAPEGRNVRIDVSVTDPTRGTANASVTITIDTQPPENAIDDLAAMIDPTNRRAGIVRFTWTAVGDAGGLTLVSYQMRCAATPITNESQWSAASTVTILTAPGADGTVQSEDVGGFRVGTTRYCTLRGADPTGALTPLDPVSPSVAVTLDFLEQVVTMSSSTQLGFRAAAIGDVNGDAFTDVLIGGTNQAYLYFGGSTLAATPSVRIIGINGTNFGNRVAGLGDFNGDGRPDFAISAFGLNGLKGGVYVFFGRAAGNAWPATIDLTLAAGCGADLCYVGDDGAAGGADEGAFLGFGVGGAGDFNGDGLMDLGIGASFGDSSTGRAYVLLGRTDFVSGTTIQVPGAAGSEPNGFSFAGDGATYAQVGQEILSVGGDMNGDGRMEILIAAPGRSSPTPTVPGTAVFVTGRQYTASGLVPVAVSSGTQLGSGNQTVYGVNAYPLGDINGDTRLDVGVYNQLTAGSIHVFLGTASGFATTQSFTVRNDYTDGSVDRFGLSAGFGVHPSPSIMRLGDIDRDGLVDLYAGSRETGLLKGSVDLFYRDRNTCGNGICEGSETTATCTGDCFNMEVLRSRHDVEIGPMTADAFAVYIGDVNGDGFSDIAVGDPGIASPPSPGRLVIRY